MLILNKKNSLINCEKHFSYFKYWKWNLGCYNRLLDGLVVAAVELSKGDCGGAPVVIVRGFVLASPEWWKATLVDIEVWRGSLVRAGSYAKWILGWPSGFLVGSGKISLNPPQRGLGVTGKSPRPRKKSCALCCEFFLTHLHSSIYFALHY